MRKDVVSETMKLLNENYFNNDLQESSVNQNRSYSVGDNVVKGTGYEDDWIVSHTVESADLFAGTPDIVLEELGYLYGAEGEGTGWTEEMVKPLEDLVTKYYNKCKYIAVDFPIFNEEQPTVNIYELDEDANVIKVLDSYTYKNEGTLDESKLQINEDLEDNDNEAYHNEVNEKLRQADKNIDWLNDNGFKCGVTYYQNMFPGSEGLTQEDYQKIYEALPNSKMQQGFSDMWEGITDDWSIDQQEYNTFKSVIVSLDLSSYKQGMFPLIVSCINDQQYECYFIPEYNDINDSTVDIQKDDLYTKMLEG